VAGRRLLGLPGSLFEVLDAVPEFEVEAVGPLPDVLARDDEEGHRDLLDLHGHPGVAARRDIRHELRLVGLDGEAQRRLREGLRDRDRPLRCVDLPCHRSHPPSRSLPRRLTQRSTADAICLRDPRYNGIHAHRSGHGAGVSIRFVPASSPSTPEAFVVGDRDTLASRRRVDAIVPH
jgi:hypothetical protein